MGKRMRSCPWLLISAASALSRIQLPQYICAAPAVNAIIFMRRSSYRALKRPAGVQVIEQVAFVRLVPTDPVGRDGAEVQPAHIRTRQQPRDELTIMCDSRYDETRSEGARHLVLAHGYHACEGEEEFAIRERMLGRVAQDDG